MGSGSRVSCCDRGHVPFCADLEEVYQLERFLTLVLARGGIALNSFSAGVIVNGQPLTCQWEEGLNLFPENGPVRRLVAAKRFHMVHLPLARLQEVDLIYEKLEAKDQELEAKDHELEAKGQELEVKDHELTLRGWVSWLISQKKTRTSYCGVALGK